MPSKSIFKRYEYKYLITNEQRQMLKELFVFYMKPDKFGKSAIFNLYYDTPNYLLIRRSIENPGYKEKLRIRSYGKVTSESQVFIELKKKYDSVVYKRRITMEEMSENSNFKDRQIGNEIEYFLQFYKDIEPKVFIGYEREAYFANDDDDFRITFDENILWRDYDLDLSKEMYGIPILEPNTSLMEIKISGAMPLWMVKFLTDNVIFKTSFSKYGNAYKQILEIEREYRHAV